MLIVAASFLVLESYCTVDCLYNVNQYQQQYCIVNKFSAIQKIIE